jgi:hypothetical protein
VTTVIVVTLLLLFAATFAALRLYAYLEHTATEIYTPENDWFFDPCTRCTPHRHRDTIGP